MSLEYVRQWLSSQSTFLQQCPTDSHNSMIILTNHSRLFYRSGWRC